MNSRMCRRSICCIPRQPSTAFSPPRSSKNNLLGYKALIAHAKAEDSNGNEVDKKWLDQFIQFKEAEKVYNVQEGTVVRQHGNDGNTFTLKCRLALPGSAGDLQHRSPGRPRRQGGRPQQHQFHR